MPPFKKQLTISMCDFEGCTGYIGTSESVQKTCTTAWYENCKDSYSKTLQETVKMAEKIISTSLPSIQHTYEAQCPHKAFSIVEDPAHPSHSLFIHLPQCSEVLEHRGFLYQALQLLLPSSCEDPKQLAQTNIAYIPPMNCKAQANSTLLTDNIKGLHPLHELQLHITSTRCNCIAWNL